MGGGGLGPWRVFVRRRCCIGGPLGRNRRPPEGCGGPTGGGAKTGAGRGGDNAAARTVKGREKIGGSLSRFAKRPGGALRQKPGSFRAGGPLGAGSAVGLVAGAVFLAWPAKRWKPSPSGSLGRGRQRCSARRGGGPADLPTAPNRARAHPFGARREIWWPAKASKTSPRTSPGRRGVPGGGPPGVTPTPAPSSEHQGCGGRGAGKDNKLMGGLVSGTGSSGKNGADAGRGVFPAGA